MLRPWAQSRDEGLGVAERIDQHGQAESWERRARKERFAMSVITHMERHK